MKQGQLNINGLAYAPRVTEDSFYPNIDSTYTVRTYNGDRIALNYGSQSFGIKRWGSTLPQRQGMAIYGNILVRMANVSTTTTHNIYTIGPSGALADAATFSCSTSGHSNALQFAPTIEAGNDYPYLYVSDLTGACEVLEIASGYSVSQVQKITVPIGWQVQIGDDGFIWAIAGSGSALRFIKYRAVSVSEGDITLTSGDILEDISVTEQFDTSAYTFQGSKFKFGKAWLPLGTTGAGQKRALFVYDLAAKRTVANIDLTDFGDIEYEDLDFWDDAVILATYSANTYILRF